MALRAGAHATSCLSFEQSARKLTNPELASSQARQVKSCARYGCLAICDGLIRRRPGGGHSSVGQSARLWPWRSPVRSRLLAPTPSASETTVGSAPAGYRRHHQGDLEKPLVPEGSVRSQGAGSAGRHGAEPASAAPEEPASICRSVGSMHRQWQRHVIEHASPMRQPQHAEGHDQGRREAADRRDACTDHPTFSSFPSDTGPARSY